MDDDQLAEVIPMPRRKVSPSTPRRVTSRIGDHLSKLYLISVAVATAGTVNGGDNSMNPNDPTESS